MDEDSGWHLAAAGMGGVLSLAFTVWGWLVNKASNAILDELKAMRHQIDVNSQRISRLEGRANGHRHEHGN